MLTLIGHGYIGQRIAKELHTQNISFYWANHLQPIPLDTSFIINAAGYTGYPNVDACEVNKKECIYGNVIWPLRLENEHKNTPILHISSGCIYSGYKSGGYTEQDEPNFKRSFYSKCKAIAQELLTPYLNKSYLFRIRMPFGIEKHQKNLLTKFESYPKLVNFTNSLICIEDLAKICIHFYLNRPPFGIYNVCNPGAISTMEIVNLMGLQKEWFTVEEFEQFVKVPRSNCVLNTDKLNSILLIKPIHETIKSVVSQYK